MTRPRGHKPRCRCVICRRVDPGYRFVPIHARIIPGIRNLRHNAAMTDLRKLSTNELIAAYGVAEWTHRKPIAAELRLRGVDAGTLFSRVSKVFAGTYSVARTDKQTQGD